MNKALTVDQVVALKAWVLVLQRAHPTDRRTIALAAMEDIGAGRWIRCQPCEPTSGIPFGPGHGLMRLHQAFAHLRERPTAPHDLRVDDDALTVTP